VLELSREVFEIAQRFGERTWIQQAIGMGLSAGFDAGRWEDWRPEAEAELPDAAMFYHHWMQTEEARRMAYRGQAEEALDALREALADVAIAGSAQASAGMATLQAEIEITQGRWQEAFESSRGGWKVPDSARGATQLAQFAAAAADDAARLDEAIRAQAENVTDDSPMSQAAHHFGETLAALLAARWDDARMAYLQARRAFEALSAATPLAMLQLAVGHLGADRIPEAAEAAREAEEFFSSRGAGSFLATYRANAVRHPGAGAKAPSRRTEADVAEAETSPR
jgi:hypothetical protein